MYIHEIQRVANYIRSNRIFLHHNNFGVEFWFAQLNSYCLAYTINGPRCNVLAKPSLIYTTYNNDNFSATFHFHKIIVSSGMQYLERRYYLLVSKHFMLCIEKMSETVAKLYKVVVNGYQT